MPNLRKRLGSIKRRITAIDRRLNMLESRVYFRASGSSTWNEVEIFDFSDSGAGTKKLETGEEVSGHRFTVRVDRDWLATYQGQVGEWAVTRTDGDPQIICEKESETFQDHDPDATVVLRVQQEITYDGLE